jgi:hypothetical protein
MSSDTTQHFINIFDYVEKSSLSEILVTVLTRRNQPATMVREVTVS